MSTAQPGTGRSLRSVRVDGIGSVWRWRRWRLRPSSKTRVRDMTLDRRTFLAWLAMSAALRGQTATDDWQNVPRVIAVGDIHGDKDALVAVLRMASVIDASERWTGGTSHVVQVGDVPARGPKTRQAFDLLMRLEQEALLAGGRVHALIGNHEVGV